MPKVTKDKHKVIHPNSRKALQLARDAHHSAKVERRHEEKNLKQLAKLKKLHWFKENLIVEKESYGALEMKILINRYLQRFEQQKNEQKEVKSIKGRKIHANMKQQFSQQFFEEKETQEFKTFGIEVPNLMKKSTLQFFKKWDGDVRFLPKTETITLSEKKIDVLISKEEKRIDKEEKRIDKEEKRIDKEERTDEEEMRIDDEPCENKIMT